jgi:hypothetical protein
MTDNLSSIDAVGCPVVQGRIWFPGNPWPDGHRVTDFEWTGRLDAQGRLWFDLTLATADYDEEGSPPDDDGDDDWSAPIAWNNYHACKLSSTRWEDATGLLAATPGQAFRLADPGPHRLTADPLPIEDVDDDPAFHIYLLGHDSVAAHEVFFTRQATGRYRIEWTGRIALTYTGDDEFRYRFRAVLDDVTLTGVTFPGTMPVDEARRLLTRLTDIPAGLVS